MKYIFVTGGVLSGIGKWISAASIGTLMEMSGYRVSIQKLDGYLNVDPGTMSPFEQPSLRKRKIFSSHKKNWLMSSVE